MPRRHAIFRSALLVLAAGALPVQAWQGRLVDAGGAPVAGARVTPIGRSGGVLADADGRFRLPGEPDAAEALLVERADGSLAVVPVPPVARGETVLEIVVPASSEFTVRVTAGAGPLLAPPGSPAFSLTRDAIARRAPISLQGLAATVPGVARASEDPDRVPVLRGLGRARTLLLLDGAPVGSERRAGVSGGIYEPASWGGVEIIRGPAAVTYGSAAMGGVLAIESPWPEPEGSGRVEGEAAVGALDGPFHSAAVRWSERGWSVAAAGRRTGDPVSARDERLEGSFRRRSLFVGHARLLAGGLLRIGFRSDRLAAADRLAVRDPARLTRLPGDSRQRLVVRFERGGARDTILVFWGSDGRRVVEQRGAVDLLAATDERDLGLRAIVRGGRERVAWLLGGELRWRHGIRAAVTVPSGPTSVPLAGGRQRSIALFARLAGRVAPGLDAGAGVRIEPIRSRALLEGRSLSRNVTASAATLFVERSFGRAHALVLQFARGFREPLLSERYYRGPTGRGLVEPNPVLDHERSRQLDLLWRWDAPGRHVEVSLFEARIDDVIVRRLIAEGGPGETDRYRFVNAGTGRVRGLELALRARLGRAGTVDLIAHRILGRAGTGAGLAEVPAPGGALAWSFESGSAWFGATLTARAAKRDPGPGERSVPGWGRLDLAAGRRFRSGLEVALGIENLLDQPIPSSPRRRAPLAPGRSLILRLAWRGSPR